MALLLKHQTAEQFVQRLRAAYRDGQRERLVAIARFIIGRIQSGDQAVTSSGTLNVTYSLGL